jgi:ribosomal protein L40E
MDKIKWKAFVSTLTTDELELHLRDILSFAKEYQHIITAELNRRRSSGYKANPPINLSVVSTEQNKFLTDEDEEDDEDGYGYDDEDDDEYDDEDDDDEDDDDEDDESCLAELDFYTVSHIQKTVDSYEVNKLQKKVTELNKMLGKKLSPMAYASIRLELDLCEFRLAEINGVTESQLEKDTMCVSCGATILPTAVFCPKCGKKQMP